MVFFSRVGNRVESSESFQEARIMSSAEDVGAPAGDTGGTAIEVAVGKRGRQPLTGAERWGWECMRHVHACALGLGGTEMSLPTAHNGPTH